MEVIPADGTDMQKIRQWRNRIGTAMQPLLDEARAAGSESEFFVAFHDMDSLMPGTLYRSQDDIAV